MIYLFIITTIIIILAKIFSQYYIFELIISFLPYIIISNIILIIISFWNYKKKTKNSILNINYKYILRLLLFITNCGLFFIFSQKFNNFYQASNIYNSGDIVSSGGIKILYSNIYKDNTDYTGIKQTIQKHNPDLIFFVEFSEHHYNNLKDFLEINYPYINSTTWSKKFIGSMVFSKYYIENWADDFPQGLRRYAYFSIKTAKNDDYYIYLIHTSSPINKQHFVMRNKQLDLLANNIALQQIGHRKQKDNVILIGDFNVSPWSYYYKIFEDKLGNNFINITNNFPILFTWKFFYFPFLQSHIDHIWTNIPNNIKNIKSIKIPGSDHKGFLFDITS